MSLQLGLRKGVTDRKSVSFAPRIGHRRFRCHGMKYYARELVATKLIGENVVTSEICQYSLHRFLLEMTYL